MDTGLTNFQFFFFSNIYTENLKECKATPQTQRKYLQNAYLIKVLYSDMNYSYSLILGRQTDLKMNKIFEQALLQRRYIKGKYALKYTYHQPLGKYKLKPQ